jgi:hypothetical protein
MDIGSKKHFGVYRGIVISNKDPLNKRRLKVTVPAGAGGMLGSWAMPLEVASLKVDSPALGQGVWVMYENGDPSYPVWLGTFGKVVDVKRHVLVSPGTSTQENLRFAAFSDGRKELDLVATLVHMGEVLTDYEARISQLEADMPQALNNGL